MEHITSATQKWQLIINQMFSSLVLGLMRSLTQSPDSLESRTGSVATMERIRVKSSCQTARAFRCSMSGYVLLKSVSLDEYLQGNVWSWHNDVAVVLNFSVA